MVGNLSHELRTPLNAILGMLGILSDSTLTGPQRECVKTAQQSGECLVELINEILDYADLESGLATRERIDFDLRAALEDISEVFSARSLQRGVEFGVLVHADVPSLLLGDPGRLRQLLNYLLLEALDLSQGGEIFLRVENAAQAGSSVQLRFTIEVTNSRLSAETERGKFHLQQSHAPGAVAPLGALIGSTFGPIVTLAIAEFMGIELDVHGGDSNECIFVFTHQVEPNALEARLHPPALASLEGKRICLVDDLATNRKILEYHCAQWGMSTVSAEDGFQAIKVLRAAQGEGNPCSLAILDMQMPGMDGLELGLKIKADPSLAKTRLILLTSLGQRGDKVRAEKNGFMAYLTKPIRPRDLKACLGQVLLLAEPPAPSRGSVETFDAAHPKPLVTRHTLDEQKSTRAPRVLVVDDNTVNQRVAVKLSEKLGFAADVASNGRQAVAAVRAAHYEVILMDCHMPEMDGYEATEQIRARERAESLARAPIVAVTADTSPENHRRCLEVGMDGFVTKPVSLENLGPALASWLPSKSPKY